MNIGAIGIPQIQIDQNGRARAPDGGARALDFPQPARNVAGLTDAEGKLLPAATDALPAGPRKGAANKIGMYAQGIAVFEQMRDHIVARADGKLDDPDVQRRLADLSDRLDQMARDLEDERRRLAERDAKPAPGPMV